jgi:peptide deformylase
MIIINNEEALRIKCEDALPEEVGQIIEELEKELAYSCKMGRPGIGLAATQIGIAKNIAIIRLDNNYKVDLVNCKIKHQYDKMMFKGEGCLSFPGRIENTMRYQEIHIIDNLINPNSFIVSGLMAIVCQHELDHLNGVLLPDIAIPAIKRKIKPNDICSCGSGKKYKKCCKEI